MAVPSSGVLSLRGIYNELNRSDYNDSGTPSNASLTSCSTGGVATINTANAASDRPDGSTPHAMSEFYAYDHDAALTYSAHMAEDFTGNYTTYDDASRTTFSTTAWGDSGTTPNMSDVNSKTVDKRPTWESYGTKDNGDDQAYWDNTGNNSSWHNSISTWDRVGTTNFDTGTLAYGECFNVQLRFYMKTGGNKDFIVYWHKGSTSKPTSIGNAGDLARWQFRDNSDGSYPRKISMAQKISGTTTWLAHSTSQFSTNTWYTVTMSIKHNSYMSATQRVYVSTTDGAVGSQWASSSINPSLTRFYGLTCLSVKAGNTSTKNYVDWIRCWMSSDWPS